MGTKSVLLIDDDTRLVDLISQYLGKHGFKTITAPTPDEGIAQLKKQAPDVIVLDVMLPERTGFDVCREIRTFSNVPIIMLTARGDVTDRVVGLEIGADDYVSKPVEGRELVARIQSLLRRAATAVAPKPAQKLLRFADLELDSLKRTARLAGELLDLTTAEFDLLALFAERAGEVLDRDKVMDQLRGEDWQAFDRSIDVLISRLRQKLKDDPKRPTYFKTVWGVGYVFIAQPKEEK